MKRILAILLTVSLLFALFSFTPAVALQTSQAGYVADYDYSKLIFNPDTAYMGQYTNNGVTFKTYQVTYAANPYTTEWNNAANFFKMNIKVPVSFGGVTFDDAALAGAPILFRNPWSGDNGSAVGAVGTISNTLPRLALSQGWIVVEPGMRGSNCTSGAAGTANFNNYGKLPNPIVDLKAALRYLRYETNATTIPGNKDLIFVTGTSSGGCGTVMLGSSGNTNLYDEYLDIIGAAPGRDDIFATVPSCPVMTRAYADSAIAWERWGDLSDNPDANPLNAALSDAFADYQASLGLTATFAVGDSIAVGDQLTAGNYAQYLMVYAKESLIKHLNSLGSQAAINTYLAGTKPADGMYGTPATGRAWIKPVYDADNPNLVVDVEGTWDTLWRDYQTYVFGPTQIDPKNSIAANLQYDKPMTNPNIQENGVLLYADRSFGNASTASFGKPNDYGAVYTVFGQDWIKSEYDITISQEYMDLIELQCNSVNPMYFVTGEAKGTSDVCKNWYMRTGARDIVTPPPIFFGLATALENQGMYVNAALVWDQGHGETTDYAAFFDFAAQAIENAKPAAIAIDAPALQTLRNKQTLQLGVTLTPADSVSTIVWSSSNPSFATVDRNGLVTAKAPGTVVITAKTADGALSSVVTIRVIA